MSRRGIVLGLLAWSAFALPGGTAFALTVDFSIEPRIIQLGDTATARVTIHDTRQASAPQLLNVPGLDFQSVGTEQSFSIGTGGSSASVSYRYRVSASRTGKYVIGPWTYATGGQEVQVPAVEFEVVASGQPSGGRSASEQIEDLLFARILTDRAAVFTQESFDLVLAIYARNLNLDRDIGLVDLKTTGLKLGTFQELQGTREVVNGNLFDVRRFRATATALTSGTFELRPTLRVGILLPRQPSRDPFSGFFDFGGMFGRYETQAVNVEAEPLEITVKPIPEKDRPADYSGAVGRFTFDVAVTPTEINAGDPVTLQTRIEGRGNFESLTAPTLRLDDRFRSYDAKVLDRRLDENSGQGRLIFEQVVIPRSADIRHLPELTFSFFDPLAERYETVRKGPFTLTVKATASDRMRVVQNPDAEEPVQAPVLGTDIVYLKPAPARWQPWPPSLFPSSTLARAAQGLPLLGVAIAWMLVRRREELERDVSKARRQEAPRAARSALRRAEQAAAAGDGRKYADALSDALASYFGHRFNLAPGEIERGVVIERLMRGGLASDKVAQLDAIFSQCEQARFGAASVGVDAAAARNQVKEVGGLLQACERLRL